MEISSNSVLYGIAAPLAILRSPTAAEPDQTLILARPFAPIRIAFALEEEERYKSLSGRLRTHIAGFRVSIDITYGHLTAAEAQVWAQLFNAHAAGYEIHLRPHNDAALKLQWRVFPHENFSFDLGYLGERYLGHRADFGFDSVDLVSAIDYRTALNRFSRHPVTIPIATPHA